MKITIQDLDYSEALDGSCPLTIERTLNKPSICKLGLSLPADKTLPTPGRNQSLRVTGDDGTVYFTGYLASNPAPMYAGCGMQGPRYRLALEAVSDELLLDQAGMLPTNGAAGETASALLSNLVRRTGQTEIAANETNLDAVVGEFLPVPAATWSVSAGQIADQACAAYRIVEGQLSLVGIPAEAHTVSESDGSFDPASLTLSSNAKRALANDVTVCAEEEAAAYVTEHFVGDGLTTQFNLAAPPYIGPASKRTIIRELFDEPGVDTRVWDLRESESSLALGPSGLTMQGGDGLDGSTVLSWLDPIEMGGTLLLEATGVTLALGSAGILAGFFSGASKESACIAGFKVAAQPGGGAVITIQSIVDGLTQGVSYAINPSNQYALRVRVHCNEVQRVLSTYRSCVDAGVVTYGGQKIAAGGNLQVELQEFVNGVAGMPVTLYDGVIANLPAVCTVVAASSTNLQGTVRGLNLTNLGSGWVRSTPANGGPVSRHMGTTAQAAECQMESSGRLVFYTGFAPAAGELIAVSYRTTARAVGRQVNRASQQALTQAGLPPISTWVGSVTSPAARSSQDCRNAAQALVAAASSETMLLSGTYNTTNLGTSDIWPGDALQLDAPSAGLSAKMIVRSIKMSYTASLPDLVEYAIAFANEWAEDLAIKTSASVPADAWLPATPGATPLANLNALRVTAINGSMITIDTGAAAPSGGGFEIRRRDHAFQPGEDTDLILRGSQSTMTFTRASASDRFYVRMFDNASPPNYSEFSAVLVFNTPVGA